MTHHLLAGGARHCLTVVALLMLLAGRVTVWYLQASSPPRCVVGAHELNVEVLSLKRRADGSLLLDTEVRSAAACPALRGARLRLSWYRPTTLLHRGDVVHAEVRLRTPWGTANPGGFDYRLWLIGRGYVATGYFSSVVTVRRAPVSSESQLKRLQRSGMLRALVNGDRSGISDGEWAVLRETGTVHLMVISGLHVGVFSGLVYLLVGLLSRPLGPWLPCQPRTCGLLGAACAVLALVVHTGADPPVVRAGAMVWAYTACLLTRRRFAWWRLLAAIGYLAILAQPGVVLRHGFWLSYAAVASLLWIFAQDWRPLTRVRGMLAAQLCLALALAPWLGATVAQQPLIAPLANLLTVPVISLLTVPAALLGSLLHGIPPAAALSAGLLRLADFTLVLAFDVLAGLADRLPVVGYQDGWRLLLCAAGAAGMMLPLERRQRLLCALACLPLLLPNVQTVREGHFRVSVLDVGQGSAAIVDTARHRLLVDAGPAFPSGFSMGEAVVLPALAATGPLTLDRFVLSHADIDHAGGLPAIADAFPGLDAPPCRDGVAWRWDGVRFDVLQVSGAASRNDASCTLLIRNAGSAVYLSGDIGRNVEKQLLPRLPAGVDLLVAPHHGSRSSSSVGFVRHLDPRHVVFSAGRDNRYGHPHAEVVARYVANGSRIWTTGMDGALIWESSRRDQVLPTR